MEINQDNKMKLKYSWIHWAFIAVIILVISWVSSYNSVTSNPRYSLGTTTKSFIAKGFRKGTDYHFFVDNIKFKGSYTELAKNAKQIIVPNGKYLVVYSATNPEINLLVINKPILDTINLDSLNQIGVSPNDIDWTKL